MERRNFILNSSLASAGVLSFSSGFSNQIKIKKHKFNLNYAPHIGMFKHHAGSDPLDQLRFMLDQGFTAFEDNNMKKRDV